MREHCTCESTLLPAACCLLLFSGSAWQDLCANPQLAGQGAGHGHGHAAVAAAAAKPDEGGGHGHGHAAAHGGHGHGANAKPKKKIHDLSRVGSVGIKLEGNLDNIKFNYFMGTLLREVSSNTTPPIAIPATFPGELCADSGP